MKTKLLKKIRKRFTWYWTNERKLIIIDRAEKVSYVVDETFARGRGYLGSDYTVEDVKVPLETFFHRVAVDFMGSKFGWEWSSREKKTYNLRIRNVEKLRNNGKVINQTPNKK